MTANGRSSRARAMPKQPTKKSRIAPAKVIPLDASASIIESVLSVIPSERERGRGRPPLSSNGASVPQRMAAVMGKRTMKARDVAQAMVAAGEPFKSKDINAYMATLLASSKLCPMGPDGLPMRRKNGYKLKVHMFALVARGLYRVATREDHQEEARALLAMEADEVGSQKRSAVRPNGAPHNSNGVPTAELRKLIKEYGTRAVRTVLEEVERE